MSCQIPASYLKVKDGVHDFSKYLLENIPEFQEVQKAKQALLQNPEALKLWDDIQERRNTIELLSTQGLPVTQETQEGLSIVLKEMNSNSVAMRYLRALNAAENITSRIYSLLGQEIGAEYVTQGSCC